MERRNTTIQRKQRVIPNFFIERVIEDWLAMKNVNKPVHDERYTIMEGRWCQSIFGTGEGKNMRMLAQ